MSYNYFHVMTREEVEESHRKNVEWVAEILDTQYGTYVGNLLVEIRNLINSYGKPPVKIDWGELERNEARLREKSK